LIAEAGDELRYRVGTRPLGDDQKTEQDREPGDPHQLEPG